MKDPGPFGALIIGLLILIADSPAAWAIAQWWAAHR